MTKPSIGKVYAICDHFESSTGQPVAATTLKASAGVDRTQLRKWVREGRLIEHDIQFQAGQIQKGYTRPKLEKTKEVDSVG